MKPLRWMPLFVAALVLWVGAALAATKTVTGTAVGLDANFISANVESVGQVSVQFTSVGSGNSVTFEESANGVDWVALPLAAQSGSGLFGSTVAIATTEHYTGAVTKNFFRVRVSTYGSGTISAVAVFKDGQSGGPVGGSGTVVGNVASGAADLGGPVKVGGRASATIPTAVTTGQRVDLWLGVRGSLAVGSTLDSGADARGNSALGGFVDTNTGNPVPLQTAAYAYNGNTVNSWDRVRSNSDNTLLASAARTATIQSADQTNYNGNCAHVILNVTSAGTGSITLTIQGKDSVSSAYYPILVGAAVTTNSTNPYKVCPGITAAANAAVSDMLPRTWRIDVTHNNANSITYSVGASVSAN